MCVFKYTFFHCNSIPTTLSSLLRQVLTQLMCEVKMPVECWLMLCESTCRPWGYRMGSQSWDLAERISLH